MASATKTAKEAAEAGGAAVQQSAWLEVRDGIAWITIDLPGKKVNTLNRRLMGWFDERLDELAAQGPRGLVIRSGKADTFIAGADIEELQELGDRDQVRQLLRQGHALCAKLAALPFPSVAAVHGACLGGGLELALTCDWRAATDHPKTKLGLPEVQLGLIPGLGGTQRLPRLIGIPPALDMILTGKQHPARRARRLGLVDVTCHPADLAQAALELVGRGKRRSAKSWGKQGLAEKAGDLLARTPLGDKLVYDKARQQVRAKTGGHYPAPLSALEVVKQGIKLPLDRALEVEAEAFVDLVVSDTAKNLMGIFFMKNDVEGRAAKLAKAGRPVPRVGVLGAGLMGAGITQVLAHNGVPVVMKDRDLESVARGVDYCSDRFGELVRRRRYSEVELKEAMARIHPSVEYEPFRHLDFVVEAVFEDVGVKHQVIRETEAVAPPGLIFASNTSTIPIAELATASRRPENVVGMHFFSPVHKMPLLEVIRHPGTSEEALATTVALGRTMGKTVIVVDDGPGFFTSRVLGPFVNEAVWCLTQGARIEQVDEALRSWGWPVGALTLVDEVGLDVAFHAGHVVLERLGSRLDPPPAFQRMIDDERKGRKAGRGFYVYDQGKKQGPDETVYDLIDWQPGEVPATEIAERCWLQMLNEVARTIEDGVIENPVDIDIGVVFGFGFPPFRGGILKEADRHGLPRVVERLAAYAERYGERLAPAQLLRDMAAQGKKFHG
ncbi:MAG TPA: 3-hydroxyacyl-CoA dehydrogenase NAD-binding domain-containing protein [Thermoanaerobaculia bacterium]|nr:3-hydroxyacyl-CoA dehydrogenase NAD-binding domain-containing protein [Thermoanaerobaculia bacterium]